MNSIHTVVSGPWSEGVNFVTSDENGTAAEIQRHVDLGLNLYTSGRIHDALIEFLQVLGIDPLDPLGHYLCGVALQALELQEMAITEWSVASSLHLHDGARWDNNWDWVRSKSTQLLNQTRRSSQEASV